jgi:hypothetical protein
MGSICNRSLPHTVLVDNVKPTTILGVGYEGVINSGAALNVTVDGSGGTVNGVVAPATANAITITIYYRTTPSSVLVADATTVNLPAGGKVIIGLTPPNVSVYEVVMTALDAAAPELVIVSSETSRAS